MALDSLTFDDLPNAKAGGTGISGLSFSDLPDTGDGYIPGLNEGLKSVAQIPRQVGLTARAALGGLGGVANMVLDPAVAGINALGGNLPIPSQAMERTLSQFLPTPANATERIAQTGARGMVPVAAVAKSGQTVKALAPFADNLITQLLSATSGSAASQGAKEMGAGPMGQMFAGLAGGIAGPTALVAGNAAARSALRVPGSLIAPFTKGGQQDIAARIFQNAASDPQGAAFNLGAVPQLTSEQQAFRGARGYVQPQPTTPNFELVPGSRPLTPEVANDPGISSFYKTLRNENTPLFSGIDTSNDAARQSFLTQQFGGPADVIAAKSARDAATGPLRDVAFAGAGPVDTAPVVTAGNQALNAGAKYRGTVGPLLQKFVDNIAEIKDPQVLYNGPRKAINDAISGQVSKDSPLAQFTKQELIGLRGHIDNQIEAVAPGFKNYLQTYADMSRQIDAQQLGQDITQAGTNTGTERLSVPKFSRQVALNGPEIAQSGSQASDALYRVNADLKRSVAPLNAMRVAGSDTVQNNIAQDALQKILGKAPGGIATNFVGKAANWLYNIPEKQIRQLITDGIIDPSVGAGLLSRRIPIKPDLATGLLGKLLPISYGGLLGPMSAQQPFGQ